MRVIAGTARGTHLATLEGLQTRPTTDRVKEAIFSMIHQDIFGKGFLDLFSGSGAMGIEFLSRGGARATFVDANKALEKIINGNLSKTQLSSSATLLIMPVERALGLLEGQVFDFVFMDPPYGAGEIEKALDLIFKHKLLAPGGTIIAEHDHKEILSHPNFTCVKSKKYGKIGVTVLRRNHEDSRLSGEF